jgi:hypothetical protein
MLLIVTAPWQERVIPYRLFGSGFDDPDCADAGGPMRSTGATQEEQE